jgi:hypothetical protein
MFQQLPKVWQKELMSASLNWNQLDAALKAERGVYRCFPPRGMEFTALWLVAPEDVSVAKTHIMVWVRLTVSPFR